MIKDINEKHTANNIRNSEKQCLSLKIWDITKMSILFTSVQNYNQRF